ncbi:MAG TPA: class I SAM-dependent methyltransferase [Gemmataceae bacterium]|jgi:SAM-dependent methyltransferase|nr:class I SAM-dependent methyltransferase [Gemmataceae bacterium]
MSDQASAWSAAARSYEEDFVDPYRDDVRSPLAQAVAEISDAEHKVAADLGCGIGPLLPALARKFQRVYAVDFADEMLRRAREKCGGLANVEFLQLALTDLGRLAGAVDVAVAVNSLVLPNVTDLDCTLRQVHTALRPGGIFLGIVPAMDAVHYYTMLLLDRALAKGLPPAAARKNAAHLNDHELYDFAFGQFRYKGLEQHFWQPFEVRYRLRRAGFRRIQLARVLLAWEQFTSGKDLTKYTPPWDWFFHAERT